MKLPLVLVLTPALVLLGTAALAADPPPTDTLFKPDAAATKKDKADIKFINEASRANLAEVQFSQLAAGHSSNRDVITFASSMIDDHSKANAELIALAQRRGYEFPTDIGSSKKAELDKVAALPNDKFDAKYLKVMISDHQEAVKLFEKESKFGFDPELKSWATSTLPTLQHHLEMAEQLQKDLKAGLSNM